MNRRVLRVDDLHVRYANGVAAVRGVTLDLVVGEMVAVVGESGCGKSTLAKSLLGLLPPDAQLSGDIAVDGHPVTGASPKGLRALLGSLIGYVGQDPYAAMNPLMRVGRNVAESWRAKHLPIDDQSISEHLSAVGIEHPEAAQRRWPHEWSGGMLQRANIAGGAALDPALLVADEPTSALDYELADTIMVRLRQAARSVLVISHDLGLVLRHADRLVVMYAGRIVEHAPVARGEISPRHPYTRALLAAIPVPGAGLPQPLGGEPPDLSQPVVGCPFANRCAFAHARCLDSEPELVNGVACVLEEVR